MTNVTPMQTLRPDMPFAGAARETLFSQLAALDVWAAFLPKPDCAHEHHQMRIAAKRLRYSLDLFRDVLPDTALACYGDLKALQAGLGNLHDLDTLFLSIEDAMLRDTPPRSAKRYEVKRARQARQRASLEALLSSVAADRDAQHQRAVALWDDMTARAVFAPLHAALQALELLPDTAHTVAEPGAGEHHYE